MTEKLKRLDDLRARIVRELYLDEWRDVWFFPPFDGVAGWRGTQRVMFVGLAPSTGYFPTEADRSSNPARRLYAQLKRNGFGRAHLTDVIKERAVGRDVGEIERDKARMERYRRYFRREIEIVQPRLIVAMGHRTDRILRGWRGRLGTEAPVLRIPHYSARFSSAATRRCFTAKVTEIRRRYERI